MIPPDLRLLTNWGTIALWCGPEGVHRLVWPDPGPPGCASPDHGIVRFLDGGGPFPSDIPVDLSGQPPFRRAVFEALRRTEVGETLTYGDLALRAGRPGPARAVGQALKKNPVPILVPCHRVVGAGWRGGYSFPGGLDAKARLLDLERAILEV